MHLFMPCTVLYIKHMNNMTSNTTQNKVSYQGLDCHHEQVETHW
jgi:hypothetical protein